MRHFKHFLLILVLFSCISIHASASEPLQESYLVPKFISADDNVYPIYDAELAEFMRRASNDAYSIYKGNGTPNLTASGFSHVSHSYAVDESVMEEVWNSDDELVRFAIPLETHFITSAKQVRIGGETHKVVVIAFQGTLLREPLSLISDALLFDVAGFHAGFISCAQVAYNYLATQVSYPALDGMSFSEVLEQAKSPDSNCHILVTGHSLGGAVANLFTSKLLNEATNHPLNTLCYTFAAPLVCADWRAELLDGSNIINIINELDAVPHVGYRLNQGTRPGHVISDAVMEDLGDLGESHGISKAYKELLQMIETDLPDYYPHLYRRSTDGSVLHTACWGNDGPYLPVDTLNRFDGHRLFVHGGLLLEDNTTYPFSEFTIQGGSVSGQADGAVLACDLIIESGNLSLGTGTLTIEGDLRIQGRDPTGAFTGGEGHLLMKDEGHLLVLGDVCFQGGNTNFLYNRDMIAGTLEVKGDFTVLPSTGGQAELVFCPGGTHRVLLSGSNPQTIYFAPYVDDSSYVVAYFNHFETTNPHPLIAPEPISFESIDDDLTFVGDLKLSSYGSQIARENHIIAADSILLEEDTLIHAYANLTLDGDVTGGRLDIGDYLADMGTVTITGDLIGTDIYFSTSQGPSALHVMGDYINNNADLCFCDGQVLIDGDFRYQVRQTDGSYTEARRSPVSIYEGARLEIGGTLYIQMNQDRNIGLSEPLSCILKGDLIQIYESDDENYFLNGLSNLILAGDKKQMIDTPRLYFENITLANTSPEGVTFLHPLFGLSGVFNAYGRSDGSITPYQFPANYTPEWKDTDGDGAPDYLDPQPEDPGTYAAVPAVISGGVLENQHIRFLYSTLSDTLETATVLAAIYRSGQLMELRALTLEVASQQIQGLVLPLEPALGADFMKIFQLHGETSHPLWATAQWRKNP